MLPKDFSPYLKTAVVLVILVALSIPLSHQVAPAWTLRVIDQQGMPLSGIETIQTWRHPLYQPHTLNDSRISDAQGRVAFPERTARASGLLYLYRTLANIAELGTDAVFGPDVWVYAKKDAAFGGSNNYTSGQTPPDTVLIRRYGVCPASGPGS